MTNNEIIQAVLDSPPTGYFQARIYLFDDEVRTPLRYSLPNEHRAWGVFAQGGWLQAGGEGDSPISGIEFRGSAQGRLWVKMHTNNHRNELRVLDRSANGYLGLYETSANTRLWKLQPLEWTGTEMLCYLRDHLGNRVGVDTEYTTVNNCTFHYLKVGASTPSTFLVKKVDLPGKREGTAWLP
ncbi:MULTISPECIES: hypothetical protein [Pseudomonas]|uniref:hypothetical protein n=1 Tax=Pseudomonas TaxID=286 RepID=UPI001E5D4DA4|nr:MULTISPECIES: hypothetical protein [Pseudomonas]MCE1115652.1 hypothetical protein [Pseudomonas sp. NMI795_08]